jgi:hypothetical protein
MVQAHKIPNLQVNWRLPVRCRRVVDETGNLSASLLLSRVIGADSFRSVRSVFLARVRRGFPFLCTIVVCNAIAVS